MKQIFIELFSYRDEWRRTPETERQAYVAAVSEALGRQRDAGLEVIGWGFNDPATDRRAPHDFYCVYTTPSWQAQRAFEAEIAAAGWYDRFEQVNISGAVSTPEALLQSYARLETPAEA